MGLLGLIILTSMFSFGSNSKTLEFGSRHVDFEVVTWNIQKGNNPDWKFYVNENSGIDYWGIQEAVSLTDVLDFLQSILAVHYNPAWTSSWHSTGTLSASKRAALTQWSVVTHVTEPIANTPKSFIVSDHDFGCGESVRVVNTHMINFLLGDGYVSQLGQIREYLIDYTGPLIVLGDFNNWNWLRSETLSNWADSLHLSLAYEGTIKLQGLDHIFYRGLRLNYFAKASVRLSDHEPVHAGFRCQP